MRRAIAAVNRVNQLHPWSHNDHYGRWVARRLHAAGATDVLDVGCGTGNLLDRLRRRGMGRCVGVEPDPECARMASTRFSADPEVSIRRERFTGCPDRRWSAITAVAVVHHLPLDWALRELRNGLAPGGRLVVIGCYRDATVMDFLTGCAALLINPLVGLVRHPHRAVETPVNMRAPTAPPRETLAEIRAAARVELPGARVRRRLFWRYSLVYDQPR